MDDASEHHQSLGLETLDATKASQVEGMQAFGVLLGVVGVCSALFSFVQFVLGDGPSLEPWRLVIEHAVVLAGAFALHRLSSLGDARQRMSLGVLVMLTVIAIISTHASMFAAEALTLVRPRWIALVVIAHAILVPAPRRYHVGIAVASVLMPPFVVGVEILTGLLVSEPELWRGVLLDAIPGTIAAIVAVVLAVRQQRLVALANQNNRTLGAYELSEKIGEGGMGEVWAAQHKNLCRAAAVKLIRSSRLFGEEIDARRRKAAFARFEREARLTAKLTSPHTVRLYDYGIDGDTIFYAMEHLDGIDLDELIQIAGKLPQERVHFLLLQMCDSLGEAHKLGLIHRDIKAANVFIARQGLHYDFVKILDFGLAIERENYAEGERLTLEGKITGSPMTMAPEQAFGDPVDARADIYAMGCVAYYALTGRQVFDAPTARAVLMKHVKEEPTKPSTFMEVDEGLEAIILICLAKHREERPKSVTQLYKLLKLCEFEHPWTEGRARRWYRNMGMFGDSMELFVPDEPLPDLAMTGLDD